MSCFISSALKATVNGLRAKSVSTRAIRSFTLAAVLIAASGAIAQEPRSGFSRAPYLQFAAPDLMHIAWRTMGPIEPVVRFGERLEALDQHVPADGIVTRVALGADNKPISERWKHLRTQAYINLPRLHSAPVGSFQYEVKLSGLKPSTKYFYAIFDGTRRLTPVDASYSFITQPPKGTQGPIRFWVIGDSGTGRQSQLDVHSAMRDYVRATKPLDFWIHVGDMAYGIGRDMEFQSRVFEPYEITMRNLVCWPTMGNHEGNTSKGSTGIGPYYDAYIVPKRGESGGVPSGTEAYYSFDHGNVHFICLDSHDLDRRPSGAMAKWLKRDLEKAKADWLIAFWHHPPYTKGSHDSDAEKDLTEVRKYIMPIIESGGVDLVLTGHSHIYERSMLMDGAYATNTVAETFILDDGDGDPAGDGAYRKSAGIHPHEGTVQVVAGHGGQSITRKGTMPVMRSIILEHGSVIVDVEGDTLTAVMINREGQTRDLFSIVKRGKVKPTRLALPWRPADVKVEVKNPGGPAVDHKIVIQPKSEWLYLGDGNPKDRTWNQPGYDDSGWKRGAAGIGYGSSGVKTVIPRPAGVPRVVYLRREFHIEQGDRVTELGLMVDFQDAFIAYLNGVEVAREGVGRSSGRNAQEIKPRADRGPFYVYLKDSYKHLKDGANLLAIEVHPSTESQSLEVDPVLLLED
jgi:hypothetical protein